MAVEKLRNIERVMGRKITEEDILSAGVSLQERADEVGIRLSRSACRTVVRCTPFELLRSAYADYMRACLREHDARAPRGSDLIDLEICASLCFVDYIVTKDNKFATMASRSTDAALRCGIINLDVFERDILGDIVPSCRDGAEELSDSDVLVPLSAHPVRVWSYAPRSIYPLPVLRVD